ncbi:DUF3577 domain-containing protein [bacterium endosymbiont of Bathymodiolus sp. 5 South]|uniref:DUF3577 domain-containing protein n=1 Tax=bacterium endosymbiont of Bathymodiolus sp. 5 South TaxID=1181670 RepID=UPI0010B39633|nr:DUF3577 domain-containing protein [bacterium endosymbiont of Bathymodiolus sp. 5 South]CAC9641334.1 hypothetical protein [uncultured Gammaproteobacteria bacterium]SHN91116.1 hypothetical protein BCLUESOX_1359 [bacterium endosymbiont of Bathymodiolus sp. 5 South]SSC08407.1 Periplasmic protein TonB, links inner and outer membranes [bacterium endosymbiont of Bathymodiolus sp. 5 South]VVH58632.1 hypothetical protein BSPCLSOX_1325 [uncultured Gammaproteobacteria bacterium]VVH61309.1 hypothetical
MSNQENKTVYFDLHATGVGYINRAREVSPENGDTFFACDISAMRGNTDKGVKYTKFSVRVVGNKAKEVFTQHLQAMQQKDAKVIVSFVIGDIQPASYSYVDKISKETKAGCSIDGRLIAIKSLKINGEIVFKQDRKNVVEGEVAEEDQEVKTDTTTETEQVSSVTDASKVDVATGELAQEVTLDPMAKDFNERKAELKELGYAWNSEKKVWALK